MTICCGVDSDRGGEVRVTEVSESWPASTVKTATLMVLLGERDRMRNENVTEEAEVSKREYPD